MSDSAKSIYSNYENLRDGSSYAVDIRESSSGVRRVFISETIALGQKSESRVISIPEKHLNKFIELVKGASEKLNEVIDPIALHEDMKMALAKKDLVTKKTQAGKKWTDEEEQWLLSEYLSERSIKKLARLALRNPGGVRSRLKRFGILDCKNPQERAEMILNNWEKRDFYYDNDL